jgi:hypothetical protein
MDKDTKKLVKAVEEAGFEVRYTSDCHPIVFTAKGEYVTKLATSPSDRRGLTNALSRLKRHHFVPA